MPTQTLYMAPLRGVTDHWFRTLFAEHFGGFDLAVAPFVSSKQDNVMKRSYVKDLLPEHNQALPVIPQILSKSAGDFVTLANFLYDLGYPSVNWNLGCPYPMVASKKRGSGLLPHTDIIQEFLEDALPRLKGALSIKLRLGYRTAEELLRLIPVLNAFPLSEVIIHPRTGIQLYTGTVDLDAFAQALPLLTPPVVYNGDIRTKEDFLFLSRRFPGVTRWMLGRGAIADPFLPAAIQTGIEPADKIERVRRFHAALFEAYASALSGPSHALNRMKGVWSYLAHLFEDDPHAMKKIKKARAPEEYLDQIHLFLDTKARRLQGRPRPMA